MASYKFVTEDYKSCIIDNVIFYSFKLNGELHYGVKVVEE